jgi:hypothetical protein
MSDRLVAEAAAYAHSKIDEDSYPYRNLNSQLQQSSGSSAATVIGANHI